MMPKIREKMSDRERNVKEKKNSVMDVLSLEYPWDQGYPVEN